LASIGAERHRIGIKIRVAFHDSCHCSMPGSRSQPASITLSIPGWSLPKFPKPPSAPSAGISTCAAEAANEWEPQAQLIEPLNARVVATGETRMCLARCIRDSSHGQEDSRGAYDQTRAMRPFAASRSIVRRIIHSCKPLLEGMPFLAMVAQLFNDRQTQRPQFWRRHFAASSSGSPGKRGLWCGRPVCVERKTRCNRPLNAEGIPAR